MKNLIILFLFGSADICFGQKDSIAVHNIGVCAGGLNYRSGYGVVYYAHFTYEKRKSFFAFGPVIGQKLRISWENDSYPVSGQYRLNGFHFVYQLNPFSKKKRLGFYFQNEFLFHYYTDKGVDKVYETIQHQWIPAIKSYKSHQTDISDYIGFGFKEKFLKNFYLNQSLGIGIGGSSRVADFGDINYNRNNQYYWAGLMLKIGLGYTFDKANK